MSTFVMEYEITVGSQEKNFLEKCFNIGSNISNLCLNRVVKFKPYKQWNPLISVMGRVSGSQNDTKYRILSKNSDIEFDFSKCRKADDIIFINKIIELPFEEIEGK